MKKTIFIKNIVKAGVLAVSVAMLACSPKDSSSLELNDSASLMAPPKAGTSAIRAQLSRYRGQTEYLTAQRSYAYSRSAESAPVAAAAPAGGGSPRAEQESDVFKVGKPGSKLLYLLNSYRGLQVVSYVNGTESPKLLGRAEPTGNYPSDMYLDPNHDRLYVLERVWFDSQSSTYTQNQSRILIYDVSKPENPTLAEKIDVKGEIADSRMVGNVLYLVTTLRPDPNFYRYNNEVSTSQGIVTSYELSGTTATKIQELNLSLPAVYGNNLRVVTVPEKDSYKYYLIAHLSEHGWGWWDRQSMVQVVDISDDKGKISSIMTVSVKGTIQRPHQMQIKNNTLIAVSNYVVNGTTNENGNVNRFARIAVETFTFPTAQSEVLSENEAELRRLYIDKQVKTETDKGVDAEVARQKWVTDSTWGIHGRFVKTKDQIRKITPDSAVTTGDTTGLSAQLQDVRVRGDLLYAFWVPANQIDPLDLFDISAPEKGVRHISRLTFDGWIARAEPISYKGKEYVIGLGWIVPAVNNENNRRHAQVKLFEIVTNGKSAKAVETTSLVLSSSQFWANFSGEDKKIEFRQTEDGKGEILFEGSRTTKLANGGYSYQDGGQLISFDLSQSDTEKIFTEGAFLSGNSTWIKRIFTNSEINRINSFSDASLVTFGAKSNNPSATVEAVHILELARNIRGYVTMANQGLQIIGEGNSWSSDSKEKTILRGVLKTNVDAEQPEVLNQTVMSGGYVAHQLSADKKSILVLTSQSSYDQNVYKQTYSLHQVTIGADKKLKLVSTAPWEPSAESTSSVQSGIGLRSIMPPGRYNTRTSSFLTLPNGEVLLSVGRELKLISANKGLSVQSVSVDGCSLTKETSAEIKDLNGQLYLTRKTPVDIKNEFKTYTQVARHDLVSLNWQNQKLTCGESINVPGEVLAFDGKVIVTSDSWVNDIYKANQDTLSMSYGLTSMKVVRNGNTAQAILVDMIDTATSEAGYTALPKSFSKNISLLKYNGKTDTYSYNSTVLVASADKDGFLTQDTYTIPDSIVYGNLVKVFADTKTPGTYYGVVKSWRQMQVIRFHADGKSRPTLANISAVDWKNKKQPAVTTVSLLEGYSSSADGINFTPELQSIEISSGLFGVKQFFLE
jgi:hypothetical protein